MGCACIPQDKTPAEASTRIWQGCSSWGRTLGPEKSIDKIRDDILRHREINRMSAEEKAEGL